VLVRSYHVVDICKQKARCGFRPSYDPRDERQRRRLAYGSRGALFRILISWGAACRDPWVYAAARVLPSYRFDECTEDLGEVFSVVSEDAVPEAEISMSIQ
jgi:hypothetical protein